MHAADRRQCHRTCERLDDSRGAALARSRRRLWRKDTVRRIAAAIRNEADEAGGQKTNSS
jgi:hypothetical protein